ncbi:GNAT family N-acetyltransferase [Solimonas fluminis]|uniref:GNAT family N-acetyltransferase n=1 Tax=Solimonas fluminis TaxID=2086571 RepID=A0A2S5TAF5_9GAMM|nr:GNAT family N-acetyltransferase [Solimonas fluminis]PPE71936.1 GNAT family N-acetyltransferase [Solimonas fluminis]
MSLGFRPARAEDAEAAAPLVYSAGPEAFDYMLRAAGRGALDFLRYAFAQGGGFQGHRNHWVAEREGRVVGVGAFYGQRDEGRLTLGLMRQVLSFYPLPAAFGVIRRGLELSPMMKPLTPEMLYVANFGVAPECRGQGIGARMLNFQMAQARQRGFQLYALDVAVTNPRAQKLYEGIGFRFVRERRFRGDRARSPVPDCRRLEMKL